MNIKVKIIYLILSFNIIIILCFLLYKYVFRKFFNKKSFEIKDKIFQPNSNYIKVENRIYYNKSFGLNHLDICQKEFLMEFNRKTPDFKSNILITMILIYPNPFSILKSKFYDYINIVSKEINFNFSIAIITCNHDISNLLIRNDANIKLKYISKFTLNNIEIPNSECFSFVTHSRNKTIDVFYTNTLFSKFNNTFLNKRYYTSVSNYSFRGYYAAGTNYYAYAPSHIAIFDFFDFFIKFDMDLIKKLKNKPFQEPFPLKRMIANNNYFFFACRFFHDARFVTTNLYKTFLLFSLKQKKKCDYTVLPINLYKYEETISAQGAVNIGWLGFYTTTQIRFFSEEYISASYGLYTNRWGDQQFFIPTLYGFNYNNYSYFSKNTYLCSWMKGSRKNITVKEKKLY